MLLGVQKRFTLNLTSPKLQLFVHFGTFVTLDGKNEKSFFRDLSVYFNPIHGKFAQYSDSMVGKLCKLSGINITQVFTLVTRYKIV